VACRDHGTHIEGAAHGTTARPPKIMRRPHRLPLSLFNGATPTKAAICLCVSVPNSGSSPRSVRLTTGPMPGTLRSRFSYSRQSGVAWIR
jgi:hypothetical protein